jgi:hypothetical protein
MNLSVHILERIFTLEVPLLGHEVFQARYDLSLTGHRTPLSAGERLCVLGNDIWVLKDGLVIYQRPVFLITIDTLGPVHYLIDLKDDEAVLTNSTVKESWKRT